MVEETRFPERQCYHDVNLEEAETSIRASLRDAARSVIAVGHYLKVIRDKELYREAGYENVWDYATDTFGFSKSTASRYMARNDKFSVGGNSPVLAAEFREYSKAQLQEMLSLDAEQMSAVTPDMTVREIRELRRPKEIPYYEIPGQMSLSDFPELEAEQESNETITQEADRTESSDAASFTVTAEELIGEMQEDSIATSQQMRVADEQQKIAENAAEKQRTEVWINPEEEHVDENYNLGDMPQTKESLIKRLAALLVRERWPRLKYEFRGISLDTAKSKLKYLQRTQKLELGDGIEAAACENIIEFFRGTEDLGVCSYERFTTQVQKCLDTEWEKQKEQREAAECDETLQTEQQSAAEDPEKQVEVDPEDCEEGDDASSAEITDLQLLKDMLERKKRLLATNLAIPGIDVSDEHIRKQKIEVAALASMLCDLENTIEPEESVDEKPEQPELPLLRNNDQRAAFVDAYETWPLWIETEKTGERYYRYDLPDGTSFVVKTYHSMLYDYKAGVGMRYKEGYGANEQYILKPGKFFRDCSTNRSAMIEKLKELQKADKENSHEKN